MADTSVEIMAILRDYFELNALGIQQVKGNETALDHIGKWFKCFKGNDLSFERKTGSERSSFFNYDSFKNIRSRITRPLADSKIFRTIVY